MMLYNSPTSSQPCPAVSVIIPMYNAEKYIGECLDSILNQTFQNFEVVVVDDCSTDNSAEIVRSYAEKFGERLTFTSLEKNSGSGAMPRNKGLTISRGEYIFFVDNDDLITKTALEEMYTLAKDYDADVIYCDRNYRANADLSNNHFEIGQSGVLVDKPTLESENLAERVQEILRGRYIAPQWRKFVKRILIFEHEIFFPHTRPSDDDVWTCGLVFYAKKFLRVPNTIYLRRLTEDSIMRVKKTPQQTINFWLNPILLGLKSLDNLMSRHEFFKQNSQYRYAILERFIFSKINSTLESTFQVPQNEIYSAIQNEFGNRLGEYDVLIPALCTVLNTWQKNFVMNQQKFNRFAAQVNKCVIDFEKVDRHNRAYISKLENLVSESQQQIAVLKNEINLLKS